ncbi:MAG: outer membrane protein [Flammeovirgaceae bacterium]|jgi:outer membrane protein
MILKRITLVLLTLFAFSQANSQSLKIGYVDTDSVLISMPQFKSQQTTLQTYSKQLQAQLKTTLEKSQKRMGELQQKVKSGEMPESEAQEEAYKMQLQLQAAERDAQSSLQKKEASLLEPLYEKIETAIQDYAKTNGFTYILSQQMFLYGKESNDITGMIIAKIKG